MWSKLCSDASKPEGNGKRQNFSAKVRCLQAMWTQSRFLPLPWLPVKPHKCSSLGALQVSSAGCPARPFCGSGVCLVHAEVGAQASVLSFIVNVSRLLLWLILETRGYWSRVFGHLQQSRFILQWYFFFLGCCISKILSSLYSLEDFQL